MWGKWERKGGWGVGGGTSKSQTEQKKEKTHLTNASVHEWKRVRSHREDNDPVPREQWSPRTETEHVRKEVFCLRKQKEEICVKKKTLNKIKNPSESKFDIHTVSRRMLRDRNTKKNKTRKRGRAKSIGSPLCGQKLPPKKRENNARRAGTGSRSG